jgi:hypothetical protein
MTDKITTTAKLIEQGYLVPAKLYVRPAVLEHELHAGSVIDAYKSTCAGKRVIVYASTGAHAEFLSAQFNAVGILAYAVLARDNDAVRTAALESFTAGTCMVLITINIDLSPAMADGIIIAAPHHSARRYEHQILSAMRPRYAGESEGTDAMRRAAIAGSGKPVAMILDLADNWQRHPDVVASVTHHAQVDTHLTIPGSLEWDQTPEAPANTTVAVPREWLNAVSLLTMPLDELQEQAIEFLCEPCDAPRAPLDRSPGGAGEIAGAPQNSHQVASQHKLAMDAACGEIEILRQQLALLNPARTEHCKECGGKSLSWFTTNTSGTSGIQNGRLRTEDVTCQFVLGCDNCSETLRVVNADTIAARLNADTQHAKDSGQ